MRRMNVMDSSRAAMGVVLGAMVVGPAASATFHLMQIEQVIGGVEGDATAQAIQLRMRAPFQNYTSEGRLIAWDAQGLNPIIITDFPHNVTNGNTGDRVLICSEAFVNLTSPTTVPDFFMDNLIPESYLAAGRLTFEDDFGFIMWLLAWGGDNYTGGTTGTITNDPDGEFGPPWSGPLPSTNTKALRFTRGANATSNNNLDDYALTGGNAVFTNNARASYRVVGVGGGVMLSVTGVCPGTVSVSWSGATPGGTVALIFASNQGSFLIPPGNPCEGAQLGLGSVNIQLVNTFGAGGTGSRTISGAANSGACHGFLQLLDVGPCETSNVAQLP